MISTKYSLEICPKNNYASKNLSSKFVGSSPFVTLGRWLGPASNSPGLTITSKSNS
jgi:hypothetical protein